MLRNSMKTALRIFGLAALIGMLHPGKALAVLTVTNTGSVAFDNDANIAQPVVASSTLVDIAANPLLTVTKMVEGAPAVHARGSTLFYRIVVEYPQIVDNLLVCADDSTAKNVTITDNLFPSGFAYVAGTTETSVDGGTTFVPVPEGGSNADASQSFAGTTQSVTFTNPIAECSAGATGRMIRFQVTVQ